MDRNLHPEAQEFLKQFDAEYIPPHTELPLEDGRRLLEEMLPDRGQDVPLEVVKDFSIKGADTDLPIRVYRPSTEPNLPALVYFHGGGWVRGSIDTHDPLCRRLAKHGNCAVISIEYRRPPEHEFPDPLEDCYAATKWVSENPGFLDIDTQRIAIGGDSAGGNLAAATALLARERNGPDLAHQLLLYPAVNYLREMGSYDEENIPFGSREGWKWERRHYLRSDVDKHNPFAFPLEADDLGDLPPATMVTCEFDMLRDEDKLYTERLRGAGVTATVLHYDDLFHPFLNFPDLKPAADAIEEIAATWREQLSES